VNYRGYGRSEGTPTEQALVADALDVFDWATGRRDIDAARIALHGCSLGSGVAVQAAAQRPVKAVILTSPYDSIRDVAKRRFPYMPIAWILRHPFDSLIHAPKLKAPALVLFGTGDTLIFREQSERLAGLWGGSVERVALEGRDHNDVASDPRYFPAISGFLDRHL
jgi:pimeloyl-ACP methyl ester carboxylesterase